MEATSTRNYPLSAASATALSAAAASLAKVRSLGSQLKFMQHAMQTFEVRSFEDITSLVGNVRVRSLFTARSPEWETKNVIGTSRST